MVVVVAVEMFATMAKMRRRKGAFDDEMRNNETGSMGSGMYSLRGAGIAASPVSF
jgi:hypothetical protein